MFTLSPATFMVTTEVLVLSSSEKSVSERHIAREIFIHPTNPAVVPVGTELRAERNAAKISLTTASIVLGTYPLRISRLERGIDHDREFAEQYRAWLEQQKAA